MPGGRADQQQLGRVDEEERRDDLDEAEADRLERGLVRPGAGDRRPGIGGQRHRRGDRRQQAVVEDEHVRGDDRQAEPLERRRDQDGEQQVGGRGRHAEAQNEARDHRQDQDEEQAVAADVEDQRRELERHAGQRHHPDQHAGDGHAATTGRTFRAVSSMTARRPTRARSASLGEKTETASAAMHAEDRRRRGRVADRQEHDQRNERQQQVAALQQHLAHRRHVAGVGAAEIDLARLLAHRDEQREDVEQRRDQRRGGDGGVGRLRQLGHQERGRAHHRRHDLAGRGGRRLDRAGQLRASSRCASSAGW